MLFARFVVEGKWKLAKFLIGNELQKFLRIAQELCQILWRCNLLHSMFRGNGRPSNYFGTACSVSDCTSDSFLGKLKSPLSLIVCTGVKTVSLQVNFNASVLRPQKGKEYPVRKDCLLFSKTRAARRLIRSKVGIASHNEYLFKADGHYSTWASTRDFAKSASDRFGNLEEQP